LISLAGVNEVLTAFFPPPLLQGFQTRTYFSLPPPIYHSLFTDKPVKLFLPLGSTSPLVFRRSFPVHFLVPRFFFFFSSPTRSRPGFYLLQSVVLCLRLHLDPGCLLIGFSPSSDFFPVQAHPRSIFLPSSCSLCGKTLPPNLPLV